MSLRVAVLGAGPMGLGVAYELAKNGYQPTVFEADDRIGGMAASFEFGDMRLERYYHFYCRSDHDLFELIAELGIEQQLKWSNTKMGYWYRGKVQPWGDPISLLRFDGLSLWSKLRYGVHVFLSTKRKRWEKLDSLDAKGWVRKWVGEKAFNVLWKDLFDFKFYEYSDDVSAAWIWSRIRRIGLSRESLFREQLGYFEGGTEYLLDKLKEEILSKGGQICLQSPVTQLIVEDDRAVGVKTDGQVEKFDRVISTVPLPLISNIVPNLNKGIADLIKNQRNIAVVCVIARLRQRVTENFWLNIRDDDMDIPGLVEYSNLRPLKDSIVYVPFYLPFKHEMYGHTDQMFSDKVRSYLKTINTELTDTDFLEFRVSRYRYAQPICQPGFLEFLPPLDLGVEGLLAADTSYYYPEDRGLSESIGYGRRMVNRMLNDLENL